MAIHMNQPNILGVMSSFAKNYNLDIEKDSDLIKKLYELSDIYAVYDTSADRYTLEALHKYENKIKEFITSADYQNRISEMGRIEFEKKIIFLLAGAFVNVVGKDYFTYIPFVPYDWMLSTVCSGDHESLSQDKNDEEIQRTGCDPFNWKKNKY